MAGGSLNVQVDNNGGVTFGRDIYAEGDVTANINAGDITVGKKIKSKAGSIDILTKDGNILIGDNGPDVETVAAYVDVKLTAESGIIEVYGKTSAETGDVTLLAANDEYMAGNTGQSIIIDQNGEVEAGHDATLISENGDIHVSDKVTAGNSFNSETRGQGNIIVDKDITVAKDISMKTENGSVTVGKDITAGEKVSIETGTGNITVGSKATGEGSVTATQNVKITTGAGDIDIVKSVASNEGSVTLKSDSGASMWVTMVLPLIR